VAMKATSDIEYLSLRKSDPTLQELSRTHLALWRCESGRDLAICAFCSRICIALN